MIIITNLDTVNIDGVIHGDVVTATLGNVKSAPEIQAALVEFFKDSQAAILTAEARADKAEAKTERYDALLATAKDTLATGDLSALKTLLETKVADEAQTEKERQIADLEAQKVQADEDATKRKEEIDAKIAAIQNDEADAPAEAVEK